MSLFLHTLCSKYTKVIYLRANGFHVFRIVLVLSVDGTTHGRFCRNGSIVDANSFLMKLNKLPQMISSVHLVTKGNMLKPCCPLTAWTWVSFCTRTWLCSLKMSIKSSRTLKWKAGVSIFLLVCHLVPANTNVNAFVSVSLRCEAERGCWS